MGADLQDDQIRLRVSFYHHMISKHLKYMQFSDKTKKRCVSKIYLWT